MAKRLGNVRTVQDLRATGLSSAAVRHLIFSTHYRKELNLSEDALEGSVEAVRRIGDFATRLGEASGGTPELARAADEAVRDVEAALFDDLNAPEAVAALFVFIRKANAELDRRGSDAEALAKARAAFARIDGVLDLVPERAEADPELSAWVEERLAARKEARARRDFAGADAIRAELTERGIVIEDTPQGARWRKDDGRGTRD
jgi:cysteinyl-tRNA synthetase